MFSLPRLKLSCRERPPAPPAASRRVLLVHGNVSTGVFFEPLMAALPAGWHVLAPDLRGFGATEPRPIDATRGLRDFSDDLFELCQALGWSDGVHALGWSVGGGVVMQLAIDHPGLLATATLVAPVPPRGFGGTAGLDGHPTAPDFAGSGGGTVSKEFLAALARGDRSGGPNTARATMRQFFFDAEAYAPPPDLEEAWVDAILSTRLGDGFYPGDALASPNWPLTAPGSRGMNNAFSPKYLDLTAFAALPVKPRVFWVRGERDAIVSDASFFDLAQLGKLGFVPGWPGEARCPPQPMIAQTQALLDAYAAAGGAVKALVLPGVGHSPFLEAPERFLRELTAFVG
jgi:pimeloyl-ACP methyl ester carboxylesterase